MAKLWKAHFLRSESVGSGTEALLRIDSETTRESVKKEDHLGGSENEGKKGEMRETSTAKRRGKVRTTLETRPIWLIFPVLCL